MVTYLKKAFASKHEKCGTLQRNTGQTFVFIAGKRSDSFFFKCLKCSGNKIDKTC